MTVTYGINIETISGSPNLGIDFVSNSFKMASARPNGTDAEAQGEVQSAKARGRRKPNDIVVETYTPSMGEATWAEMASGALSRKSSKSINSKESTPAAGISKESTPSDGRRSTKDTSPLSLDSEKSTTDYINFVSGNPFVEVTKGIIHLYKDKTPDECLESEMMCMFGVPAKHKTQDLLQFTAPCHADLEYMRVIHDGSPNQYMVLLKFRTAESSKEFYTAYNGLSYNSLEPEVCSVLPVSWVETSKESEYYSPTGTELPYCTICLERMDESVSTVLTILCNHKFHSGCLAQWEDGTCPVCRYVQTPEVVTDHCCFDCQSTSDLWICLVCGYVGCGRYGGGHAHQHFLETQHCYSMELGHNRVWDYVGDNFVHRLVQNTSDGKLVEQSAGQDGSKTSLSVDGVPYEVEEKMDSLQLEYTYLLTSQLESQRRYFESKLGRVEEEAGKEMEAVAGRARGAEEESHKLRHDLEAASKEKARLEAKVTGLAGKVSKLSSELTEEKELNTCLRKNQEDWHSRLKRTEEELVVMREKKDRELEELREQVRDLMFYLEAQAKVEDSPLKDEIQGGNIVVGANETPKKPHKGVRKRKT